MCIGHLLMYKCALCGSIYGKADDVVLRRCKTFEDNRGALGIERARELCGGLTKHPDFPESGITQWNEKSVCDKCPGKLVPRDHKKAAADAKNLQRPAAPGPSQQRR